jgi:hypothetical protein
LTQSPLRASATGAEARFKIPIRMFDVSSLIAGGVKELFAK